MQIIIFSYNRACQLSVLIESLLNHLGGTENEIDVIYNTSNNKFEEGYSRLKSILSQHDNICFYKEHPVSFCYHHTWRELTNLYNLKLLYLCPFLRKSKTNFRKLLLKILGDSKADSVMFLTDDAIFIKECGIDNNVDRWIAEVPAQRQYSFRHGRETITSEEKISCTNKGYSWNFSDFERDNHWGYNFSLDAHVYNAKYMYRFLSRISFSNPNTLESSGTLHAGKRGLFQLGLCAYSMSILSFPINIVQTTFCNAALKASPELLNDYFLQGYKLELPIPKYYNTFQIYPEVIVLRKGDEEKRINIK